MGFLDLSVKDASSGLILGFVGGALVTLLALSTKSVTLGKAATARAYEGVTRGPPAMHYGSYGGVWDTEISNNDDPNYAYTYNHVPYIGATASTDFNPENLQFSEAYGGCPYTEPKNLAHADPI